MSRISRWYKVVFLLILVLGLFGSYRYLEIRERDHKAAEEAVMRVLPWGLDELSAVSFIWKNEDAAQSVETYPEYKFVRQQAGWQLVVPDRLPLDTQKVHDFLEKLSAVNLSSLKDTVSPDQDAYGLKEVSRVLSLTHRDGTIRRLKVGDRHPLSGRYYAQFQGQPGIYTLDPSAVDALKTGGDAFVDRKIFGVDPSNVRSLVREIVRDGKVVERWQVDKDSGDWQLVSPYSERADGLHVESILSTLAGLQWATASDVRSRVDGQTPFQSTYRYRVSVGEGEQVKEVVLEVVDPNTAGALPGQSAAMLEFWPSEGEFSYRVAVEDAPHRILASDLAAVLTKQAFSFYPWQVAELSVQAAGTQSTLHVRRDGAVWRAMGTDGVPLSEVPAQSVNENLEALLRAKILQTVRVSASQWPTLRAEFGLHVPVFQATLRFSEDTATHVTPKPLSFYVATKDGRWYVVAASTTSFDLDGVSSDLSVWQVDPQGWIEKLQSLAGSVPQNK